MRNTAIVAAAVAVLAGCGGKHPGTYEAAGAAAEAKTGAEAVLEQADALWEQRSDVAKLEEALAKYEEAHAADPTNRHALVRLTRGWYFYGDAWTDQTDAKVERWGRAIEWGTKCIALNGEIASRVQAGEKEKDAVAAATKDDVPCLYWTASALGKWGKAQSLSKTLKHIPTVKAYVGKVEELDPTYFHYGPSRYWGAYYAVLPSFAGQDAAKSGEYFEASLKGAPHYLGTRVLRAENLAVLNQDVAAFEADLNAVLEADPDANADVAAENRKEQEKAKALLTKKEELFGKKALEASGGQ